MRSASADIKAPAKREPWTMMELIAFTLFVFWSAAGLYFTLHRVTPAAVTKWPVPEAVKDFVDFCLLNGDPILILLAFISTHLQAGRQWTAGIARRWAVIILLFAYFIEAAGTVFSLPFGDYHYTGKFGPMLGPVPLTIPLAWHIVVTNALFIVRAVAPHLTSFVEALVTGSICTMYDYILEPFATTVKDYWQWAEVSVPPLNYVAWLVLTTLFVWIFAPTVSTRFRLDPRPVLIYALTIVIFLAGEAARHSYK